MINSEAIQRVQSLYSVGVQSDDSRLSNRHIYSVLCSFRSQLLTQEIKKNQRVSDFAYQALPCIEVEEVPAGDCPCVVPTSLRLLKSKYPIPSLMISHSQAVFRLTGPDGRLSFTETSLEDMKYKSGNRFTVHNPDYFFRSTAKGTFLYITVSTSLKTVTGKGLFNEPIQAHTFPNACLPPDPCKSYLEYEFPYEDDLMPALVEMASIELIQNYYRNKEDKRNDGKSEQAEGQG